MNPDEQWWVIQGSDLLGALRRAAEGGDPDMLYVELYANSDASKEDE